LGQLASAGCHPLSSALSQRGLRVPMNSGLQANEVRADDVREPYLRWIAGAIAFERCIEGNRQRRRPTFVKRRLFHITRAALAP